MKGSVHFDKRSGRWRIAVYADAKTRWIYKDPATGDRFYSKEHALKILGAMRHDADENGGVLNIRHWMPKRPLAVDIYAPGWIKEKSKGVSPKTVEGYAGAVNKWIIPYFKNRDMRKVTGRTIREFKEHLEEHIAPKTVYNVMGTLKTMYKDALRDEDVTRIPPFPKVGQGGGELVEYLTLEMQDKQLAAIPERDRAIFAIGMEFGLRDQEARALQKDCIVDGEITVRRKFVVNKLEETTKTGAKGIRTMALTTFAQEILDNIQKHLSPFVFVRRDGKPYTNKDLNTIWQQASKKTGIKIKMQNAMRHSLGCQLLDMGATIETVRQIYGHTRIEMTMKYTRRRVTPLANDFLERRRASIHELDKRRKNG